MKSHAEGADPVPRPENYDLVTEALRIAGRTDLIGYDKKCLVRPGGTKDYRSKNSSGGVKGNKQPACPETDKGQPSERRSHSQYP